MDVGSVKVKDNAQEIARIINSSGRPVVADAAQTMQTMQTALPLPHVPEAKPVEKISPDAEMTQKEKGKQEQVKPTTEALNNFLEFMGAEIRFKVHEKSQRLFVQLVSEKDQRVLRQYPPEEFLDMVARIREFVGIFLDRKA